MGHHVHHHQNISFALCGILENKAQHTFWHHKWHSCKWFLHSVHALYMWTWCHCWWDDGKWSRLNLISGITTGAWTKLVSFLKLFPSTNWLITFFLNSKLVVLAWFWDLVWRMCAFGTQTSTIQKKLCNTRQLLSSVWHKQLSSDQKHPHHPYKCYRGL